MTRFYVLLPVLLLAWSMAVSGWTCDFFDVNSNFLGSGPTDTTQRQDKDGAFRCAFTCRRACRTYGNGTECAGFVVTTCDNACCSADGTGCASQCNVRGGCERVCVRKMYRGQIPVNTGIPSENFEETDSADDTPPDAARFQVASESQSSAVFQTDSLSLAEGSVIGDPHFTAIGNQQNFEFVGVSGLPFAILSEPQSQLNALLHNLGQTDGSTYIKSVGFMHVSGLTAMIDVGDVEWDEEDAAGAMLLNISINDQDLDMHRLTRDRLEGVWSVASNSSADVYLTYQRTLRQQNVQILTPSLRYVISKHNSGGHLDVSVMVLDARLLNAGFMDGVLGQSASWRSVDGSDAIDGDETDYMTPELMDPKFGRSLFGMEVDSTISRQARRLLQPYRQLRDTTITRYVSSAGNLMITLPWA